MRHLSPDNLAAVATPALDELCEADVPRLLALARSVGWGAPEDAFRALFATGRAFGHRTPDGELISSSALYLYGDALASLGYVIVHPSWQRRGLAEAAVRRCLEALPRPDTPVTLVSTPQGRRLYQRLGFITADSVHRLTARAPLALPPAPGCHAAPLAGETAEAALRLDPEVFGADRRALLRSLLAQARSSAALVGEGGEVIGYGIGNEREGLLAIGPVVAPDARAAAAVIGAAAEAREGSIRVDVPGAQPELIALLRAHGFEGTLVEPLMLLHAAALPGRRERLFGLASLAYG